MHKLNKQRSLFHAWPAKQPTQTQKQTQT